MVNILKSCGKTNPEKKEEHKEFCTICRRNSKENSKMSMKKKSSSNSMDPEDIDSRLLRVKRARTIKKDQELKLKLFPTCV